MGARLLHKKSKPFLRIWVLKLDLPGGTAVTADLVAEAEESRTISFELCYNLIIHCMNFIVMKVSYQNSLKYKMLKRIQSLPYEVVLRSDVKDLSGPRQVSYALQNLTKDEKLIKLGYGVYARLFQSETFKKNYLEKGIGGTFQEALTRLNVEWKPSSAEEAYNSGKSTQVPANPVFRIRGRFNRTLRCKSKQLIREKAKKSG